MTITHKLKTNITNINASTTGFDVELKCQAAYFVNTGNANAKLYFNNDNSTYYMMEANDTLTIDINSNGEILNDTIKVEFETGPNPNLTILKQIKSIIK